jgi:hypothetical protein
MSFAHRQAPRRARDPGSRLAGKWIFVTDRAEGRPNNLFPRRSRGKWKLRSGRERSRAPQYALAHAFYADRLLAQTVIGMRTAHEAIPLVRALVQRALDLDPLLPEAHAALCVVASAYDYDWTRPLRVWAVSTFWDPAVDRRPWTSSRGPFRETLSTS